ncbi:MAG: histone deacetylase [Gammaproteobacteria bacterium]|nr:histone deacetylase [Gammaproteobacteria bacterium]
MSDKVLLYYDDAMLGHNPTGWDPAHPEWTAAVQALLREQYGSEEEAASQWTHPERPARLSAVRDALLETAPTNVEWRSPRAAEPAELARVHTRKHVTLIEGLAGRACWLDVDTTAVSPDSVTAARLAAGSGISALEAIAAGDARRAFCCLRPPGHHALAERAMGFCLYNNMAVAAAHALEALGMERVLIVDWDLHHGNGTQDIFYHRNDVLFCDTHCSAPFYPGTGRLNETGDGAGTNRTLNVPLPAGSGNAAVIAAFEQIFVPAARAFEPQAILVSSGYDGHYLDQTFAMDAPGFAQLTRIVMELADRLCDGRLVLMMEGGYNAEALADGACACVATLAGAASPEPARQDDDPGLAAVAQAVACHAARLHPDVFAEPSGRQPRRQTGDASESRHTR